jgi:hypothetical protein
VIDGEFLPEEALDPLAEVKEASRDERGERLEGEETRAGVDVGVGGAFQEAEDREKQTCRDNDAGKPQSDGEIWSHERSGRTGVRVNAYLFTLAG